MTDEKRKDNYGPVDQKYFSSPDPIADFLDGQSRDLQERIDKFEEWLGQRKRLMYENLDRMDYEIGSLAGSIEWFRKQNPYDQRGLQGLERSVAELELQKRLEKSGAWKDAWLVNKEMIELMKQSQQLKRRDQMLK